MAEKTAWEHVLDEPVVLAPGERPMKAQMDARFDGSFEQFVAWMQDTFKNPSDMRCRVIIGNFPLINEPIQQPEPTYSAEAHKLKNMSGTTFSLAEAEAAVKKTYDPISHYVAALGDRARPARARRRDLDALIRAGARAVPAIAAAVRSFPVDEALRDAAAVFARIGESPDGFAALSNLLRDDHPGVRAAAAYAFSTIAETSTRETRTWWLRRLLQEDANADVRDAAVSAIARLGGTGAKRVLTEALTTEKNANVRASLSDAISDLDDE